MCSILLSLWYVLVVSFLFVSFFMFYVIGKKSDSVVIITISA